jgi:hypothetical protein
MGLLMLKLLLVLSTRPAYVETGALARPAKMKAGRLRYSELWQPNLIERAYAPKRAPMGTHASPTFHRRRGHVTHVAIGSVSQREDFVSASSLPRLPTGEFNWDKIEPAVRERFWKTHKRKWLEPTWVGLD